MAHVFRKKFVEFRSKGDVMSQSWSVLRNKCEELWSNRMWRNDRSERWSDGWFWGVIVSRSRMVLRSYCEQILVGFEKLLWGDLEKQDVTHTLAAGPRELPPGETGGGTGEITHGDLIAKRKNRRRNRRYRRRIPRNRRKQEMKDVMHNSPRELPP